MFDQFVIAGVPLLVIVLGLVEACKKFGLSGNILTIISLVIGVVLCIGLQITSGLPADVSAWITVVVTGLMFGLTASGIYDFATSRLPKQ